MKNKKVLLLILSYLCAVFSAVCACVILAVILIPDFRIALSLYFCIITGFFVFAVLFAFLRFAVTENTEKRKKIMRCITVGLFVFYLILLVNVLLLGVVTVNKTSFVLEYNKLWLRDVQSSLIPFRSVARLLKSFATAECGKLSLLLNLGGSIILYTPFAVFMPIHSKSMRSFDTFLPFIIFLIIAVELFQGMFGLGTCDIDDLILGAGGVCVVYFVFKAEPIVSFFKKYYIYR